ATYVVAKLRIHAENVPDNRALLVYRVDANNSVAQVFDAEEQAEIRSARRSSHLCNLRRRKAPNSRGERARQPGAPRVPGRRQQFRRPGVRRRGAGGDPKRTTLFASVHPPSSQSSEFTRRTCPTTGRSSCTGSTPTIPSPRCSTPRSRR